jgi:hypothetical protein
MAGENAGHHALRGDLRVKLKWKREPGSRVQAPISHGGKAHHYVISHRPEEHTVSYRPPGQHHHVGSYRSERDAKAAAQAHADTGSAPPSNTRSSIAAWGPGGPPKGHATKKRPGKTKAQLDREIAEVLNKPGSERSERRHSTKLDRDDARMFGRYARRMEQTKAQALANARSEGFGAHQLDAVEEGWEAERRDTGWGTDTRSTSYVGFPQHATRKAPASEKKRQIQELQRDRDRYLQAMGYAGNSADQVRRYHDKIAEIDGKLRRLLR